MDIRKKTKDNWHSNFENDEVELSFIKQNLTVCCWGTDDFGIEKVFESEEEALKVFEMLKNK